MSTAWKIVIGVLGALIFIGVGWLLHGQATPPPQEQDTTLELAVEVPGTYVLNIEPKNAEGKPFIKVVKGQLAVYTVSFTAQDGYDAGIFLSVSVSGALAEAVTIDKEVIAASEVAHITVDTSKLVSNTSYAINLHTSPQ